LRPEKRFESVQALLDQIREDRQRAEEVLRHDP
jgi:FAD synthase